MKYCPNPTCPHLRRSGIAAEYLNTADTCRDCSTPLVDGPQEMDDKDAARSISKRPWQRIGVTVAVPVAVYLLTRVKMPGVYTFPETEAILGDALSILSLGITPILTAFVLVEIAAAVVPAWRRLRIGGPVGRARLKRAAITTALVLTALQGFGLITYLKSLEEYDFVIAFTLPMIVPLLSIIGGTGMLLLLAHLNDRFGLGNGLCVLILYEYSMRALNAVRCFIDDQAPQTTSYQKADVLIALLLLIAVVAATRLILKGDWKARTLPKKVDVISGLLFIGLAWQWGSASDAINALLHGSALPWDLVGLFIATALSALVAKALSNHPVRIAELVARCGEDPDDIIVSGPALRATWTRSLAYVGLLFFAWWWTDRKGGCLHHLVSMDFCLYLVVSVAALLDIASDFQADRTHGDLQSAWPFERLWAIGPALRLLERNGIKARLKNAHVKTILQFAGPFVPVELMVPADRVKQSQKLLYEALLRENNDEMRHRQ
jgi:hypothetical protein